MVLLSIIIPVFNAEKTIARTLNSLEMLSAESKKVSEVVLVNDGTTDASIAIASQMQASLSPLAFRIVEQENQGLASARNTGLRHAAGEWILLLDADDELACDPVPLIRKYREASALTFSIKYRRGSSLKKIKKPEPINLKRHLEVFTARNALTVSSIVFKRESIRSFFNPDFLSLEDWHFWMTNPLIFEKVKTLPEITSAVIHLHSGNMSSNAAKMGIYRERVAENVLQSLKEKLTFKQRNNLLIQAEIGLLQQGQRIRLGSFLLIPSAFSLYGKLILYSVFGGRIAKFGFYAN